MGVFERYQDMRQAGESPAQVYLSAREDGLSMVESLAVLLKVFELPHFSAEEVAFVANDLANAVGEYYDVLQETLLKMLKLAEDLNISPADLNEQDLTQLD